MSTRQNNTHPVSRGVVGRPAHCHCRNRTCQECRDQADDMAAADLADMYAAHAVETTGREMTVVCGGCEMPMEATRDGDRLTTQRPCGCGWTTQQGG